MKELSCIIMDPAGLHARPATMIASCAMKHKSSIYVFSDGNMVDGESILELMGLYVKPGQELQFCIDGEDEEEVLAELKEIVKKL